MTSIALALALFLQAQFAPAEAPPSDPTSVLLGAESPPAEAAPPAADESPAPVDRIPAGAPHDDYGFVAWCYGSLRGYLDLHDQVMPEVTRIETTYRPPGRKLSDDLKVYADMQKDGRAELKEFQAALTAAEKASVRPINVQGAAAVAKGQQMWRVTAGITPARLAQEWMSWALPARCETTSKSLREKAVLMGGAFKVNDTPDPPPAEDKPAPAPEAPSETPTPSPTPQ
jgi:hypothetical protein